MTKNELTRRGFLGGAAVAGALLSTGCGTFNILKGRPHKTGRYASPNERLNIACIGVGGMGGGDTRGVSGENLVAFCDVDDRRASDTFKAFPDVPRFKDYRILLDTMEKQIDALTISTPDHMHAPIAMRAIRMGKHVRVQKPLTHTVEEARALEKAAAEHGVVTAMGIQGHSSEGTRLLCEWIWAGAIGPVREVQYWTNRPIWPQGINRPTETPPVPEGMDWQLWLGGAPWRPYHDAYAPFKWRGWWDFGTGALGDIGCHAMDAAFWSLHLKYPERMKAISHGLTDESAPIWSVVTLEFPERDTPNGKMPPLKMVWHDGGRMPARPAELEADRELPGDVGGQLFIGEKGKILADNYCANPRLIPETRMQDFLKNSRPDKTIPRVEGTYQEFITACKGGPAPGANFDFAAKLTETCHLGNIAVRTGRELEYDGERMRFTNYREADDLLRTRYRKGFDLDS